MLVTFWSGVAKDKLFSSLVLFRTQLLLLSVFEKNKKIEDYNPTCIAATKAQVPVVKV